MKILCNIMMETTLCFIYSDNIYKKISTANSTIQHGGACCCCYVTCIGTNACH
eukprot:m.159876 g.159876  ORF g.159876 m.159876 type:complete len:53 (-) comp15159_c0_seq14:3757-3915(-)